MATIVFAHSNSDDRAMYAEYLEARGYEVVQVSTTDAATGFVQLADLLLTGLMVPGDVDAIELIAGAAHGRWGRAVPVVVVTACHRSQLHCRAAASGASRILLKPCFPADLLAAIQHVLTRDADSVSQGLAGGRVAD